MSQSYSIVNEASCAKLLGAILLMVFLCNSLYGKKQ